MAHRTPARLESECTVSAPYNDPSAPYDGALTYDGQVARLADAERFVVAMLAAYRRGGPITRAQVREALLKANQPDPAP